MSANATVAGTTKRRPLQLTRRLRDSSYPLGALVFSLVAWEAVVRLADIKPYILPAPSVVLQKLVEQSDLIVRYSLVTGWEIILGYLLSIAIGIPMGVAIYQSKFLERIIYPFLVASQTIPKIAIAPLLVIWFGWGLMPKVIVAFLIAVFPIVIDTVVGLKNTRPEMFHLVRSMGATPLQTFIKISLPNALPNIFGGLKVAITLAVVGAVVGEFIAADSGLGYLLVVANGYLDTPLMFAGIVALSALGIAFFFVIEVLERIFVPWRSEEHPASNRSGL
jgi:NitT/TauT family transport system permease protein